MAKKRPPKKQVEYATRSQLASMYWSDRKRGRRPSHISTVLHHAQQRRAGWKAARRASRRIQLVGGSVQASSIQAYRKLSRGGKLTAKQKNLLGPTTVPPMRLTGKAGADAWNAFHKSGFRAWATRRAKYGPSGRGKKGKR